MARFNPHHDAVPIYAAAERWRDTCLLDEGSLLFPASRLWTAATIAQVRSAYVDAPDEGTDTFLVKLRRQLADLSDDAKALAAELLWILLLFPRNISAATKRNTVAEILSWRAAQTAPDAQWLSDEVLGGLGSGGVGFNTHRHLEFTCLLDLVTRLKELAPAERHDVLSEPWAFSKFLRGVQAAGGRQFPHIVEHLLFPDTFERISSGEEKRRVIVGLGGDQAAEARQMDRATRDRRLLAIRQEIAADRGSEDFDFYEDEFTDRWKPADPAGEKAVPAPPLAGAAPARNGISFADRQKQFRSAIEATAGEGARLAENFGFSNSARVIEGGLFACTNNLQNYSKKIAVDPETGAVSFVFLCVLTFPPHDEVYFAITVRAEAAAVNAGLINLHNQVVEKNAALKAAGRTEGSINNNVKFFLTASGQVWFDNEFLDSLAGVELDPMRLARVDRIEFAIWPPTVSARRSLLAREFVGYLGRLVGRDRVHELKIWTAEDGVGPLMQRMPATLDPVEIRAGIARLGGVYSPALVDRFHAGLNHLAHKHFVILSGLSGTGKTLLAIQYALTIHGFTSMDASDPLLFVCPVRPEWTDPSGLTGYEDRLSDRYVVPPFLEALLVATANPASPVFVVLDEMNLARVEYYFSDILSAVESRHDLQLHSSGVPMEGSAGGEVPAHLRVPTNLFLIGTINVDETTSTLSDKVLDRAVVIDMSEVDFDAFFTALGARYGDLAASIGACRPVLTAVNALLIPHGLGFGYRLAEEFVRYHAFASGALKRPTDEVIDEQLIQKALVRLRGGDAQGQLLADLVKVLEDRPRARARIERLSEELKEFGAFQSSR
jgi:MoxR-like ATPase